MKKERASGRNIGFPKSGKIKKMWGDRIFDVINAVLMIFICLVIAYPLYYVLLASFTDPTIVNSGKILLYPENIFLGGYKKIFQYRPIWTGYANTLIYTLGGTAAAIAATIPCAFALSRKALWGRRVLNFLFTFTMFFSGGMIPSYIQVLQLGLMDNIGAMVLPGALSVYNMIVARTFIQSSIPYELYEAASIDGCSDARYFFSMVLPLSKAVIAVIALFSAVGHWNSYFSAMIYLNDPNKYPLQIILREILIMNKVDLSMVMDPEMQIAMAHTADVLKYSLIVVATVPILVVYPFVQKYFVKGVMIGSIKG